MDLSIIILNYKSAGLVKQCLRNIDNLKLPFESEIIVIDNNSYDDCGKVVQENFPLVKFIESGKNLGMGSGNNLGIKVSQGKYILIINPDVVVTAVAIETLYYFLEQNPKVGVVGPQLLNPDKTKQESCWRWHKLLGFLYRRTFLDKTKKGQNYLYYFSYQDIDLDKERQVDWVMGGCCVLRKKALEEVGLFDERFFLFMEDTDLCRHMWQKGWQVWYLPQAKFIHYPHRLSGGNLSLRSLLQKNTWIHIASWLKYFWKWR